MSDFRYDPPPPDEARLGHELRDILDSAVRDEPPLFLDPAQIVAAGEIRTWRRRLTASVVLTALAAVAFIAAAVPLLPRHGAHSHAEETSAAGPTPSPALASPTPETTAFPKSLLRGSPLPADPVAADRLSNVLIKLVDVPSSHYRAAPTGTKPMEFMVTDGAYRASADMVDQQGYGHIFVTISGVSETGCDPREVDCLSQTGPNGALITIRTMEQSAGGHDWVVTADRVDGIEVTIQVSDYRWASAMKGSAPSQRDSPPMTLNRMIILATDPSLHP